MGMGRGLEENNRGREGGGEVCVCEGRIIIIIKENNLCMCKLVEKLVAIDDVMCLLMP